MANITELLEQTKLDQLGHERWVHDLPVLKPSGVRALLGLMRSWHTGKPWTVESSLGTGLLAYAVRHGLGGIAGKRALEDPGVTKALGADASCLYFSCHLYHERAMRVCRRIQQVAMDRSIALCFMKGPAMIQEVYEDGGVRPYGDIDIFVSSRDDALALMEDFNVQSIDDPSKGKLSGKLHRPAQLTAYVDDHELEFSWLAEQEFDPMADVLGRNRDLVYRVPESPDILVVPPPNIHMLYLMLHMTLHHCFSRLIWFLDLSALFQACEDQIDCDFLRRELPHFYCQNVGAALSRFCRTHLLDSFPHIPPADNGLGAKTANYYCLPEVLIAQPMCVCHPQRNKRIFSTFWWIMAWPILSDVFHGNKHGLSHPILANMDRVCYVGKVPRGLVRLVLILPAVIAYVVLAFIITVKAKRPLRQGGPSGY